MTVEVLDEDLGVYFWTTDDDRTAYAIKRDEGTVLIDPLPLDPSELEELGQVTAILLTSATHERAAWRLRDELKVPVWAPALALALAEEPDDRYGHSMVLPADLVSFQVPGAAADQHALILDDYIAFVPDLVRNRPDEGVRLAPDDELQNPVQARETVRLLLEQSIEILCPGHGRPIEDDVHGQLQAALEAAGDLADPDYVEVPPEELEDAEDEERDEA
jgi:glyoxylase-like metal-dependent hydrolase (beta-lactamase superfamily II)